MHELKEWPQFYSQLVGGMRKNEVRHNDRGFEIGDVLQISEYVPEKWFYTGRTCQCVVTSVTPLQSSDPSHVRYVVMDVANVIQQANVDGHFEAR